MDVSGSGRGQQEEVPNQVPLLAIVGVTTRSASRAAATDAARDGGIASSVGITTASALPPTQDPVHRVTRAPLNPHTPAPHSNLSGSAGAPVVQDLPRTGRDPVEQATGIGY